MNKAKEGISRSEFIGAFGVPYKLVQPEVEMYEVDGNFGFH